MIQLTHLNGDRFTVNADLIEVLEVTPDTVITLTTGTRLRVRETTGEIVEKVVGYRRRIGCGLLNQTRGELSAGPDGSESGGDAADTDPSWHGEHLKS